MAFSRWSFSRWYIYHAAGSDDLNPTFQVCGDGYVTLEDLKNSIEECVEHIVNEKTSDFNRKELYLYFKYIKELYTNDNKIELKKIHKCIEQLRHIGKMKRYLEYKTLPFSWKMDGVPPKEKALVIIRRNNYKKTGKNEDYLGIYTNNIKEVVFINEKEFQYRDENLNLVTKRMRKHVDKPLFENYPILVGVKYKYWPDRRVIVNHKVDSQEWKDAYKNHLYLKIDKINEQIKKLND